MLLLASTMDTQALDPPHPHRNFLDFFVKACQADERVVAAFLGGSYGRGAADAYSDVDLYLVTSDGAYDEFFAGCEAFLRRLGQAVFLETLGRGQRWWAYGQLEALRLVCVSLARLRHNFNDPDVGSEPLFKVERALPVEQLSPLQATICPMEPGAMLQAALGIVNFYQELAPTLASAHGIAYPAGLERVMLDRLEKLRAARSI